MDAPILRKNVCNLCNVHLLKSEDFLEEFKVWLK